jgi:hypothetical protein
MPTLEMIRLRSVMPNTGLLTLRHQLPPLNPVEIPQLPVLDAVEDESADSDDLSDELATENDAEKGGDAR